MVPKPAPGAPDALPQASDIPSPECHSRLVALVVEASRTMQTIVEKSLAKSGIVAVCVASEAGAEKALQTGKFDLLILGAAFGGSIGSSALREVCEVCRGKGIPVLALTIDQIADAEASGIDAIVTIPIVPDKLARSVRQLIARTGRSTDAPNPESRATPARELPELSPEPLDARALGDLEKLGGHDFMRDIVAQYVADAALVLASLAAAVASAIRRRSVSRPMHCGVVPPMSARRTSIACA
jgi:CheY-like chemotaxis protein